MSRTVRRWWNAVYMDNAPQAPARRAWRRGGARNRPVFGSRMTLATSNGWIDGDLMRRAFIGSLGIGFVVMSWLCDKRGDGEVITGIVTKWKARECMSIVNDQTDPGGFRIALRETVYEGDGAAIVPGVRVTVSYRSVGERLPIADRVRVHPQ
jgi:hypothetical protein